MGDKESVISVGGNKARFGGNFENQLLGLPWFEAEGLIKADVAVVKVKIDAGRGGDRVVGDQTV